jgi:hypothetical protein
MLNDKQLLELYQMTKAIYHHLGLDVDQNTPISLTEHRKKMELDVLKWKQKQANKRT